YSLVFHDASRTPARKKVALRTRTKREAEALRRTLEDAFAAGRYDPWRQDPLDYLRPGADDDPPQGGPDLTLIGPAIDAFLAEKARLRATTHAHYSGILNLLLRHVSRDLPTAALAAEHVLSFLDQTRCNVTSRRN